MMNNTNANQSRRIFIQKAAASTAFITIGNHTLLSHSFKSNPTWKMLEKMPYKLQEIYCGVINNRIHIAGGFISSPGNMEVSTHHIVYNPKENRWEERAPLPLARHHPQLIGHQGNLFVFGGFEMQSAEKVWVMHRQSWLFDNKTNSWEDLKSAPQKHAESVSASLGDFIHIVGGRQPKGSVNQSYADHQDTNIHMVYDPGSNLWDQAAPALVKRNSAAGAVIEGQFYVVGGRQVNGGNLSDLEIYDQKEDKWRKASPMPQGQGGLAAGAVHGKLYAFGGEYFNHGGGVYQDCWSYNPKSDQWSASVHMLTPRHGLAGTAIGDTLYAIGGAKKMGGQETSELMESIRFD